ncbi:MAG: hypothetical protein JKY52_14485 [Flavobacteriales bacterium]|nr:hypothetical protein [Flavobacteriales bacterium]
MATRDELISGLRKAHAAGDIAAVNEFTSTLDAMSGDNAPTGSVEPPTAIAEPDFTQRMREILDRRTNQQSQAIERAFSGENTPQVAATQLVGQTLGNALAGTALDTAGEIVSTAGGALADATISEEKQKQVGEFVTNLVRKGLSTDGAQFVMKWWDGLSIDTQENLSAGGNLLPTVIAKTPSKFFTDKGQAMKEARLRDTLKPPQTAAVKEAEALGDFRIDQNFEDMVTEVATIKGVKSSNAPMKNLKLISDKREAINNDLLAKLEGIDVDISPQDIQATLDNHVDLVRSSKAFIADDAAIEKAFNRNVDAAIKIIKSNPLTPAGVLKSRREFDKLLFKDGGKAPEVERLAKDAAGDAMRKAMSELVEVNALKAGIDVKTPINRMHKLFIARENLAKSHGISKSKMDKVIGFAKAHPYIAFGLATGTGGSLAGVGVAGAALGAAGVGAFRAAPSAVSALGSRGTQSGFGLAGAGLLRNQEDERGEVR